MVAPSPEIGGGHAFEDLDVQNGGSGGYSDELAGAGTLRCGGEGCGPGSVALLVLRGAVVAGAGKVGLSDFAEVEGEVRDDVWMGGVDAAVDDGDADAFTHGGVPWAGAGAAGDVIAVSADLLDGPALRGGGVEGVVGLGGVDDDAEGGVRDGLGAEKACGDDAVVGDVVDVGLGG